MLWKFQHLDHILRGGLAGIKIHAVHWRTQVLSYHVPASQVGLGHGQRQNYLDVNEG